VTSSGKNKQSECHEAYVVVSGKVQGVWFRASTLEAALSAGARGYVRNLPDGRVEAVVQGTEEEVRKVIDFMRKGPQGALVIDVEVSYREAGKQYSNFFIAR